jgi:hypothetical protein
MNVIRATVIHNQSAMDVVVLHTDYPSPVPHLSKENLPVMFHIEANKGEEYVKANFPNIPIKSVPN